MLDSGRLRMSNELELGLKHIFRGIRALRNAYSRKKFTIDGRLVGDIGEVVAATYYDISLYDVQKPGHDGHTSDGKKVQVKATFKESLTFSSVPDYYLGIKLFENGKYEEIFNGPGKVIFDHYKHRAGIGTKLLSFPIKELKVLSQGVAAKKKIAHIRPRRNGLNK
jgi:hypothetical protein